MAAEPRRSTRVRKPVQSFEATTYAIDILYTHLKNADTLEDFMSTLFMFYTPACHRPDKWNTRTEYGSVWKLVNRRAKAINITDVTQLFEFANEYAQGILSKNELTTFMKNTTWGKSGMDEFVETIGMSNVESESYEDEEDTGEMDGADDYPPTDDYDEDEDEEGESEDEEEEEEGEVDEEDESEAEV
jgi:hypothetical protein